VSTTEPTTVLITDPVDPQCVAILEAEGLRAVVRTDLKSDELKSAIATADALIVRSQTKVTADILSAGTRLKAVGRAGAGVDNIDVEAATRSGIIVMNTPGGNTVSTAEHTVSMMLALARNIPQANQSLREGKWDRKRFTGAELHGKTLGIIGLGKVGAEVARRCGSFGMTLVAYDPLVSFEVASKLGVTLVELDELFHRADIITLHTPLLPETRHLINEQTLAQCKPSVRIVNCARGEIIDEQALLKGLQSGKVAGAALDVFETEPPSNVELVRHSRVVATPHLGASTEEAQEKVSIQIAHQIADVLKGRGIVGSVNGDILRLASMPELRPYLELAEKMGGMIAQVMEGTLKSLTIGTSGPLLRESHSAVVAAAVKGVLTRVLSESVNYLNAPIIARERGISISDVAGREHELYSQTVSVQFETERNTRSFVGTVFEGKDVRIVGIDGFHFALKPEGHLLLYYNLDKPGMLARVSGILARGTINIAGLSLGRLAPGTKALTVVSVDNPISKSIIDEIAALDGVSDVKFISL
jgi:D-3-phosphoglycerate dehydrogenase